MEIASVAFGPKDSVRYLKIQFMENRQEPGKVIGRSKIMLEEKEKICFPMKIYVSII